MPIKGVILVTHNIEEAVLMCDRILVFGTNPGRIVTEITVTLPQPRDRLDPSFRALVERIYVEMTARPPAQARRAAANCFPGTGIGTILPRVSSNLLSGLMETVAARALQRPGRPARDRLATCRWRSTICFRSPRPCR